jgi:hypothetical protein
MNPRTGLEQLAAVCLACQEIVDQKFETRGWTLSNRMCADQPRHCRRSEISRYARA